MALDNRKLAFDDLAVFCAGIVPSKVGECPSEADGISLAKDLMQFAIRVDRVIREYGEYVQSELSVTDHDLFHHFTNTLCDALQGNATYVIEEAAREREDEIRQDATS